MSRIDPMAEWEPGDWLIFQSSWVIQDGNHPNFAVGERHRFAVEACGPLSQVPAGVPSAQPAADGRYDATGRVAFASKDLLILDIGILAYVDLDRGGTSFEVGSWISGELTLAVDHYAYAETHAKRNGVPPAIYPWKVERIWRQTAPWIRDPASTDNTFILDPDQRGWEPVPATDAGRDDGLAFDYLLRCRLEPVAPTYEP